MRYRVLVGAAVLSAVAGKTFAQATADSSTWEGQYQGTRTSNRRRLRRWQPRWCNYLGLRWIFHFNSETTESEDFYYLNGSNPFNFATGASWEWTLDVNDVTGPEAFFLHSTIPAAQTTLLDMSHIMGLGEGTMCF